jgi:macrodomain Ter protein organizer (MatP/YcbG family)
VQIGDRAVTADQQGVWGPFMQNCAISSKLVNEFRQMNFKNHLRNLAVKIGVINAESIHMSGHVRAYRCRHFLSQGRYLDTPNRLIKKSLKIWKRYSTNGKKIRVLLTETAAWMVAISEQIEGDDRKNRFLGRSP